MRRAAGLSLELVGVVVIALSACGWYPPFIVLGALMVIGGEILRDGRAVT